MKMRKLKIILILSLICFAGCQKKEIDCEEFCSMSERHSVFIKFETEKQFQYFRACPCWGGDSISEKYIFAGKIADNKQIVDFLLNKLHTENNVEVLEDSLELLNYVAGQKDLRGRKDISNLVYETINRIPEKDERDLLNKILGREIESRKERLNELAKRIEERVK